MIMMSTSMPPRGKRIPGLGPYSFSEALFNHDAAFKDKSLQANTKVPDIFLFQGNGHIEVNATRDQIQAWYISQGHEEDEI